MCIDVTVRSRRTASTSFYSIFPGFCQSPGVGSTGLYSDLENNIVTPVCRLVKKFIPGSRGRFRLAWNRSVMRQSKMEFCLKLARRTTRRRLRKSAEMR